MIDIQFTSSAHNLLFDAKYDAFACIFWTIRFKLFLTWYTTEYSKEWSQECSQEW